MHNNFKLFCVHTIKIRNTNVSDNTCIVYVNINKVFFVNILIYICMDCYTFNISRHEHVCHPSIMCMYYYTVVSHIPGNSFLVKISLSVKEGCGEEAEVSQ